MTAKKNRTFIGGALRPARAAAYIDVGLTKFKELIEAGEVDPGFPIADGSPALLHDVPNLDAYIARRKAKGKKKAGAR